jgi:hypothetical protein
MIECVPINDSKSHTGQVCDCRPNVTVKKGEIIVVHMAFDGRHLIEEVNEILGNSQKPDQWEILINENI